MNIVSKINKHKIKLVLVIVIVGAVLSNIYVIKWGELYGLFIKSLEYNYKKIKEQQDAMIYGGILVAILIGAYKYIYKKIKPYILLLSNNLKTERQKINSVNVEGSILINKRYLNSIQKSAKRYDRPIEDFYLAKLDETSQWLGIINEYDFKRSANKTIHEEIKKSFKDEFRTAKIVAFIHGRGGSGKSTLLRRMAVDLVREDYCILWLNHYEISNFYNYGINSLRNNQKIQILIIIEDWGRLKQNTTHAVEIINIICNFHNVRIIMADRNPPDNYLREHIFNTNENIIEISSNENDEAIKEIMKKVPQWSQTARSILEVGNIYNSTLYLILWVIAREHQGKNNDKLKIDIRREDFMGHFQSIVESDLRIIADYYPGLARALYYYASIYSKSGIYFGLDTFLSIADLYDEEEKNNKLAFSSSEIFPILNIYIYTTKRLIKSAGNLSLVLFNHDTLADEGISKIQNKGWHKFDISIILEILPIIIENGDDYSASAYFYNTLKWVNAEDFQNDKRIEYLNKLIYHKNNRGYYLNALLEGTVTIGEPEKRKYILFILKDFLNYDYSTPVICNYLNYLKDDPEARIVAKEILSRHDFLSIPYQIISVAINIVKEEAAGQKTAALILSYPDFFKLHFGIVSTAMGIIKDLSVRKYVAEAVLAQHNFLRLHHSIVSKALNILSDDVKGIEAAATILSQPKFYELPDNIVSTSINTLRNNLIGQNAATAVLEKFLISTLPSGMVNTALNVSKNVIKRQEVAKTILRQSEDYSSLKEKDIISTALNILKDDEVGQKAAEKILIKPDFFRLPQEIVSTALNISHMEELRQKAVSTILLQPEFWKFPKEIVIKAMKISNNSERIVAANAILSQGDAIKIDFQIISTSLSIAKDKNKAEHYLKKWETTDWGIIYQSLLCFANQPNYPSYFIEIVNNIIDNKSRGKRSFFKYSQLLKIPLWGIAAWDNECEAIIRNYHGTHNASMLNSVLISHRSKPNKIKNMCEILLNDWKEEIVRPIKQLYGETHYGDNIKVALGHPNLSRLAKVTAQEILTMENGKPGSVKEYLVAIATSIIFEDKYPEWIINSEDMNELHNSPITEKS